MPNVKKFVKDHAYDLIAGTAIVATCASLVVIYKNYMDDGAEMRQEKHDRYMELTAKDLVLMDIQIAAKNA